MAENMEDTIRQIAANVQTKDAYDTGARAFNYRMAILIIQEIDRLSPGTKERILTELDKYVRDAPRHLSGVQDRDLLSFAQKLQQTLDGHLDHLREELQ